MESIMFLKMQLSLNDREVVHKVGSN